MCQQGVLEIGSCRPWPLSGLAVAANNKRDNAAAGVCYHNSPPISRADTSSMPPGATLLETARVRGTQLRRAGPAFAFLDQSERSNSANQKRERQVYLARSRGGIIRRRTSKDIYIHCNVEHMAGCLFV